MNNNITTICPSFNESVSLRGAIRVNNLQDGSVSYQGENRDENNQTLLTRAVPNAGNNPNYIAARYGPTITLSISTGRVNRIMQVDADGFEEAIEVPEVKDFCFCSEQIEWLKKKALGVQAEQHEFAGCHLRHYHPQQFDGMRLCGFALAGVPCAFGERCNMLHPVNFPPFVARRVERKERHGPAGPSGAPRPHRIEKKLLCFKTVANSLGIKIPVDYHQQCSLECRFAHSLEEQVVPRESTEFMKRVSEGTLDMQRIVCEIYRVLKTSTVEVKKQIFKINKTNDFPAENQSCLDKWFTLWSKGAAMLRKGEDKNALALFSSRGSNPEENIVWEICRRFNVCWTSKKQLLQEQGGKENLVLPGPGYVDNRTDKEVAESKLNKITIERDEIKAKVNNSFLSKKEREDAQAELTAINPAFKKAEADLKKAYEISICQGGVSCKNGVHADLVDSNGFLGVIDMDNFIGRTHDRVHNADIVTVRSEIIQRIDALRTRQKLLKEKQSATKAEAEITQKEQSNINMELETERNKLLNAYNTIKLFDNTKPPIYFREQVLEDVVVGDISMGPELLKGISRPETPEEIQNAKLREKQRNYIIEMKARVIKSVRCWLWKFRSMRMRNHLNIVKASGTDAKDLYTNLIGGRYGIIFAKSDKVNPIAKTADNRIIYYQDEKDEFYSVNSQGNYVLCKNIICKELYNDIDLFVKAGPIKFNEFVTSGAYTAMSFTYYLNDLYSSAWSYFLNQKKSWNVFIADVMQMNYRWNKLGVELIEVAKDEHLVPLYDEHYVACEEKEKFANFWSYYFNIPKSMDSSIVGTAGAIAQENLELFKEFLDSNAKMTFSDWLSTFPKYKNTLLAMQDPIMAAYSFRTVHFFINMVRPVSDTVTIQMCAENESVMRMWIYSAASKNVPSQGVDFATFATMPYEYLEFYGNGLHGASAFEQFMKDKSDGWMFLKLNRSTIEQQTSLAYLHKDNFQKIQSQVSSWNKECLFTGEVPSIITINNGSSKIFVTPSVHDAEFAQLAMLLSSPIINKTAIQSIIDSLPKTEQEASAARQAVCDEFKLKVEMEINSLKDAMVSEYAKLNRRGGLDHKLISELQTAVSTGDKSKEDSIITTIDSSFKKVNSTIKFDILSKFKRFINLTHIEVDAIIEKLIQTTTTSVCAFTNSSDEEQLPNLLAVAHKILSEKSEDKAFQPIKKVKSSSSPTNSRRTISSLIPPLLEEIDDNIFSTTVQRNELLLSGRFNLAVGKVLYMKNVRCTSKQQGESKKVINNWIIGPFASVQAAKPIAKGLCKKMNEGCISIKKYQESKDDIIVFEIYIQNKANKIIKRANKYNSDEGVKNHQIDAADADIAALIPFIAEVYGYNTSHIFAPELEQYIPSASRSPITRRSSPSASRSSPTAVVSDAESSDDEYESDSEAETSDDDDDEDDEIIVDGSGINRVSPSAPPSASPDWMNEEMRNSSPKQDTRRNKGRR